jgi:hypothetical protein
MNLPTVVAIPPEVMARQVGDETVILHLGSGNYFGLDPVGARVWQLLTEGKKPAEICDGMLSEYDVERADLERDVARLLQELVDHGLVTVA